MTNEQKEILNLNKMRRGNSEKYEFIFEDSGVLYPTKMIFNSPTYGKYILTPFVYINIIGPDYLKVSKANTEIREMFSSAFGTYTIKENMGQTVEFVIYLCDEEVNKDWFENNKNSNASIFKHSPNDKLPIATKDIKSKLSGFFEKYPMTKI